MEKSDRARVFRLHPPELPVRFKPFTAGPGRLLVASSNRHTPEQQLVAAVLVEAIHCFQRYRFGRDRRSRRLFGEAEGWLMSEATDWPFSCENICAVLGVDPEYLRGHLLFWRDKIDRMLATEALHRGLQGRGSDAGPPATTATRS
jgi:hypothetical protein